MSWPEYMLVINCSHGKPVMQFGRQVYVFHSSLTYTRACVNSLPFSVQSLFTRDSVTNGWSVINFKPRRH